MYGARQQKRNIVSPPLCLSFLTCLPQQTRCAWAGARGTTPSNKRVPPALTAFAPENTALRARRVGTLKRYAYSGCVPLVTTPGNRIRRQLFAVRMPSSGPTSGWTAEAFNRGVAPLCPWPRVELLARTTSGRYRFTRRGGACIRGKKPQPRKSWGPLLPSRTPNPRNTAAAAACGPRGRPCRA